MPPVDLLKAVHRRPFEPFALHLSDGKVYQIRHPELLMVGLRSAVVGVPPPEHPEPVYDHYEIVDLIHIVRLAPLPAKVTGDGAASA
jgi:hypothetical protein